MNGEIYEEELNKLRERLDETDRQLSAAFCERMQLSARVAALKKEAGRPVYDPAREENLFKARCAGSEHPEAERELYQTILRLSRAGQRREINEKPGADGKECYGLLGREVSYSLSPQIQAAYGIPDYRLFSVPEDALAAFLRSGTFRGLNVTIPYKKSVIPFLTRLDPLAARIGAVNTIRREADGTFTGYNTDAAGFAFALKRLGTDFTGQKVLILGNGGASAMAQTVLRELGAGEVITVSRKGPVSYDQLAEHADAVLLVNATPVGMPPLEDQCPADLDLLPSLRGVMDLVYTPFRTKLVLEAEKRGIAVQNGLTMLAAQALKSRDIWMGEENRPLSDKKIDPVLRMLREQQANLILIGMPGSGKSTQGKMLARKLRRPHFDTDTAFLYLHHISPADYIRRFGEVAFREEESAVLRELCRMKGIVLSTGGGAVLRECSREWMKASGILIWLEKDCEKLARGDRPLSKSPEALKQMEAERLPIYRKLADLHVNADGTRRETLEAILQALDTL